jgi:glycosyltransferase involved in cell wall biosynthesis
MSRDRTVCMMRIKNEARWLGRNLERTWQVCGKVVLWDDGSTDGTEKAALESCRPRAGSWLANLRPIPGSPMMDDLNGRALLYTEEILRWVPSNGWVAKGMTSWGPAELHFLKSPYTAMVRSKMRRNELRDKNCLWWYVKGAIDFDYVLCLDGDEVLSKKALAAFGEMWAWLSSGSCDWITLPFIYLWDSEDLRRIDGIYGDRTNPVDPPVDGSPKLRFPRFFSIRRLDEQQLYDTRFHWLGTRGGLHCGSIPQEGFHQIKPISLHALHAYVLHYGYLDDPLRKTKFTMYNEIDPNNQFEGYYMHIIGEPNALAPGPVQLVPWADDL